MSYRYRGLERVMRHWRAVVTVGEVELGWMAVGKGAAEQSWKAEAAAAALIRGATATSRTREPSSRDSKKAARCCSHRHWQYPRDLNEPYARLATL